MAEGLTDWCGERGAESWDGKEPNADRNRMRDEKEYSGVNTVVDRQGGVAVFGITVLVACYESG